MKLEDIKYDTPIKVTKERYQKITKRLGMIVAHRIVDGEYYIKLWDVRYKNELHKMLT